MNRKAFKQGALLCLKGTLCLFILLFCTLWLAPKPSLLEDVHFGTLILDKKGYLLRAGLSKDQKYRYYTKLEDINPYAIECLLSYEDKYFFAHPGLNPLAMGRALLQMPLSGRLTGASTITMQLARLRFKLKTSDLFGKIRQICYALLLERHYSKEELLEAYFNLAPYGANIEGIEAASRIYFHKAASKLTASECVALTVIPQNPLKRKAIGGLEFNKARKRLAAILGLESETTLKIHSFADLPFYAQHLAMQLEKASPGSQRIYTTIERDLQKALERIILRFVRRQQRLELNNAAAILVDCESMQVSALVGSANFFDPKIEGQIDGSLARRSPGSTLKPFIYALALDQGLIHPMSILPDSPKSFAFYNPENIDHNFRGPIPAKEALKASRNLPAIWLSEKLKYPNLYDFLSNAEVNFPKDAAYYGLALSLGGAELSMRELATLYVMLANKGLWRKLRFTKSEPLGKAKRLLSPEAAWLTLDMLREECFSAGPNRIPVYAKTGTSNGMRDAWTAGICGQYAIIVWIGNFNNRANPHFIGAKSAKPLFEEIANYLAYSKKLSDPLAQKAENIIEAAICLNTGDLDYGQCENTGKTYYIPGISPIRDSGIIRPIYIDRESGLRLCEYEEAKADKIWHEFWPSDLKAIFAQAGIEKADPPPYLRQCPSHEQRGNTKGPDIKSPKKNVLYQRRVSQGSLAIPLKASADAGAKLLHWYADATYLGSSKPEESIIWQVDKSGSVLISVVDDLGRSKKQKCEIRSIP